MLELARGKIAVQLNLKRRGHEQEIVESALAHLPANELFVSSLFPSVLAETKRLCPEITTGLSALAPGWLSLRAAKRAQADFVMPHWGPARLGFLKAARRAGIPVIVWTLNSVRSLERYLADGRGSGVISTSPTSR